METTPINRTLLYTYDPSAEYKYDIMHTTEYPYNSFPRGFNGRVYKKTRFKDWNPVPEDIIIRHIGNKIHVNFSAIFDDEDLLSEDVQFFQLRSKRLDIQNYICEQINFFTALYDKDNVLITSMLTAKYITDSQTYTIEENSFREYYELLYDILFDDITMEKIHQMVYDNEVGDDVSGLFAPDFIHDIYVITFQMKIMHIFIEHFIKMTGNNPLTMVDWVAKVYKYAMDQINVNMYPILHKYVSDSTITSMKSNSNWVDMQAINGVTLPTEVLNIMNKTVLRDGLIKLTFASEWDYALKRPKYSCVGLIKSIINSQAQNGMRTQLRYSLVNTNDISQLLTDDIGSNAPVSLIRSMNVGNYQVMVKDLNIIIAEIALITDTSIVDFYLKNLVQMNDFSKLLIDTVLYNRFHSSISTNHLNNKQKYIVLLYTRYIIMRLYNLNEIDTLNNDVINIIMGKPSSQAVRTLTKKDLNQIKKYVKLNNLKQYIRESDVESYTENISKCVLSSYTIVNHNDPNLLGTPLIYDSCNMTLKLLDTIVMLFEYLKDPPF